MEATKRAAEEAVLASMAIPVSPPRKRRREGQDRDEDEERGLQSGKPKPKQKSPFQLTAIRDLPASANVDTVSLKDLVDGAQVREVWHFNFLFDVDFVLAALHAPSDTLVHIVHGFWKREDPRRTELLEAAERHRNVRLHTAPMREPFGTHHSKMMVIFEEEKEEEEEEEESKRPKGGPKEKRPEGEEKGKERGGEEGEEKAKRPEGGKKEGRKARVVIHTANMIPQDWTNLSQGVWQSPVLEQQQDDDNSHDVPQFKRDLLQYVARYGRVCEGLRTQLALYDFAAVRGTLVASVPGRHRVWSQNTEASETTWGWQALQQALRGVPVQDDDDDNTEIIAQVSSVATLGATDAWIRMMAGCMGSSSRNSSNSLAKLRLIFPTANEIRWSLDGYASGMSIHTKIQSAAQQKQLQYLRPLLCHWDNSDVSKGVLLSTTTTKDFQGDARRGRAAPHIKTYLRIGSAGIDWALLTSANLSKQAWGERAMTKTMGEPATMRICSWEIGVLVHPEQYGKDKMQPVFGRDGDDGDDGDVENKNLPLRMPYSLPLRRYAPDEVPWVGTMAHYEPDWRGETWSE